MNCAAQQLFSSSALALDQYRTLTLRHIGKNGEHPLHGGGFGYNIAKSKLTIDFSAQCLYQREISKGFHSTNGMAGFIPEQCRTHTYGDFLSIGPDDGDRPVYHRVLRFKGVFQNTSRLTDAGLKDFAALSAYGVGSGNTGDFLCSPIEGSNSPIEIYRKHPVCDTIQDDLGLGREFRVLWRIGQWLALIRRIRFHQLLIPYASNWEPHIRPSFGWRVLQAIGGALTFC